MGNWSQIINQIPFGITKNEPCVCQTQCGVFLPCHTWPHWRRLILHLPNPHASVCCLVFVNRRTCLMKLSLQTPANEWINVTYWLLWMSFIKSVISDVTCVNTKAILVDMQTIGYSQCKWMNVIIIIVQFRLTWCVENLFEASEEGWERADLCEIKENCQALFPARNLGTILEFSHWSTFLNPLIGAVLAPSHR